MSESVPSAYIKWLQERLAEEAQEYRQAYADNNADRGKSAYVRQSIFAECLKRARNHNEKWGA